MGTSEFVVDIVMIFTEVRKVWKIKKNEIHAVACLLVACCVTNE